MNIGSQGATNYYLYHKFYSSYALQPTTAKYLAGDTFFMAVSNCSLNTPTNRTEDLISPYPYVIGVAKTANTIYYDVKTSKCVDFCLSDTFQNTISKVC